MALLDSLNKKMLATRMRSCCNTLYPLHKFPKPVYGDLADAVVRLADFIYNAGGSHPETIQREGAKAAFYICVNACLYNSVIQVPSSDAHSKVNDEDVRIFRKAFDGYLKEAEERFCGFSFDAKRARQSSAVKELISDAEADPDSLDDFSEILRSYGQTCAYSEWLYFFKQVREQKVKPEKKTTKKKGASKKQKTENYVGDLKDGKKHGKGTFRWPSGEIYVGEWKDGNKYGKGTQIYADGNKYVGEWKDGKQHGQGTVTYANGNKYVGELKDGKRNGQGTDTFADGSKYVGEWKDDKQHGKGTYTFASGSKYVGEWKDHKQHGKGTYTYADGDKYVGEWKDGKKHGQGTETYADGSKYVGEWKDDNKHGKGTYTYADGTVKSGVWSENDFIKNDNEPDHEAGKIVDKPKDTEVNWSTGSIKERLEAVKDLEDQGLIDADQAKKKRDEILGEL